jgi:hypothetical protein
MRTTAITTIAAAVLLAATAVVTSGAAGAVPTSGTASDVVKALQDQGYNVQFNQSPTMPLSRCTVSGVNGLTVIMTSEGNLMMMMQAGHSDSVYVDLSCPASDN